MKRAYFIAALPSIVAIVFGWIIPLIVSGRIVYPLEADGGGRVPDGNGVCCIEPDWYYHAKIASTLLPILALGGLIAMVVIRLRSRRR